MANISIGINKNFCHFLSSLLIEIEVVDIVVDIVVEVVEIVVDTFRFYINST